ncbi:MAG: DUF4157 domain-containing protein [Candidatus Thiodiazotropha sp. L084R]
MILKIETSDTHRKYQRGISKSVSSATVSANNNSENGGIHCACAGGCPECKKSPSKQAKLVLGDAEDKYEREAVKVSESLERPAARGHMSRNMLGNVSGSIDKASYDTSAPVTTVSNDIGSRSKQTVSSGLVAGLDQGKALDAENRSFFESRFRADLGMVRLHDNSASHSAAAAVRAQAFTMGQNVVLGSAAAKLKGGNYKRVLAHEITHVLQQKQFWSLPTTNGNIHSLADTANTAEFPIQRSEVETPVEEPNDDVPIHVVRAIGEFNNAGTVRDPENGFAPIKDANPIPHGAVVLAYLDRQVGDKIYTMVEWAGGIEWVAQKDLVVFDDTFATQLDEGDSSQIRKKKSKSDFQSKAADTFISTKETRRVGDDNPDEYRQNVDSLLAEKIFTENQTGLLARAKRFVDEETIPTPRRMDFIGLENDLLVRIKSYYRFLVEEGLITGNIVGKGYGTYGARTPQRAHELSTKWMLNKGNTGRQNVLGDWELQVLFCKQLVEIGGKDRVTDVVWVNSAQVEEVADALIGLSSSRAELEIANLLLGRFEFPTRDLTVNGRSKPRWEDPGLEEILKKHNLSDEFKQSFERFWLSPVSHELYIRTAERGIDRNKVRIDNIVREVRDHFSQKEQEPQVAPALEGYLRGAAERYPNILDVSMTEHLSGDAADIHFDYKFNYFDPIVDAVGLFFGLRRPALGIGEYWHYEAVGKPLVKIKSKQDSE